MRFDVLTGNGLKTVGSLLQNSAILYRIIQRGILGYHKHRDNKMIRARRVLSGWFVAVVLGVALVVPVPGKPAGAIPHEDTSLISVSFAASEQGGAGLSSHGLACHMHFEHHQLVHAESAFAIPARDSVRAFCLMNVNPLASLAPYPPKKPPRA